ncbi:MAG: response regulator [Candidatus Marinimicrobia bacterium]|nr:response regulator [Candidatus Neomarinimicrobiota bacterium]MCH8305595.1 response regulator [Candidatus Neomarinimicrobiota bacterium]
MSKERAFILLVDDDELNLDLLSRKLQRNGYDTITAVDGKEAISLAESTKPDLILMDMSLPELDGWEATRQLKADNSTKNIPVISLTANAMPEDRAKALAAGCDEYETKPIVFENLFAKMEILLRKEKK